MKCVIKFNEKKKKKTFLHPRIYMYFFFYPKIGLLHNVQHNADNIINLNIDLGNNTVCLWLRNCLS